eukprot:15466047-Alexandrium_andersonii.AAC.1
MPQQDPPKTLPIGITALIKSNRVHALRRRPLMSGTSFASAQRTPLPPLSTATRRTKCRSGRHRLAGFHAMA